LVDHISVIYTNNSL